MLFAGSPGPSPEFVFFSWAAVLLVLLVGWVGHACVWTYLLNNAYGRPYAKQFLKPFRLFVGVVIAAYPLLALVALDPDFADHGRLIRSGFAANLIGIYFVGCVFVGGWIFPLVTISRLFFREKPRALVFEDTDTHHLWPELGHKLIGDGKWKHLPRLPFNGVFTVDFTELTLALRKLPPQWDGLSVLVLSDFHFHGTPSQTFFDRVIAEINKWPPPDVVALPGDFLDTNNHHHWIPDLIGKLKWKECGLAILGNHDAPYDPDRTRGELAKLGFRVVSDRWEEVTIRGVPCVAVGHEGPWFKKVPDLSGAPAGPFRLCLSHTPDNFYWAAANGIDLVVCGHVHGGQIRIPVVGSIFIPSVYSRRFDMGVFQQGDTVMVVNRGLSGKEPLRFRCNPQVIRLTLRRPALLGERPA